MIGGSGPGARARDGCSVELYRRLPYAGDLDEILDHLPAGARVLELGCGAGRLTRRLLELGCTVTAVDNSREMLAHVPEAATRVHADIESLALPARFDVALLASGLVNHADVGLRRAMLRAAAAHLAPGGRLLVQRHDPDWIETAQVGPVREANGLRIALESVRRADGVAEMTLAYGFAGETWTHDFRIAALDEAALGRELALAGYGAPVWLDARCRWAAAAPA